MAPLFDAVKVEYVGTDDNGTATFKGIMDGEWALGDTPHGGYVLAQVLDALIEYQSRMHPEHLDPLHITAHYLYRNLTGPFEVHVKPVKHGRTFTNLTADFVQEGKVNLSTHSIFSTLTVTQESETGLTQLPPSPYARRIPLRQHPSQATPTNSKYQFDQQMKLTDDLATSLRNYPEIKSELFEQIPSGPDGSLEKIGGGGVETARWLELKGSKTDHMRSSLLGFLVDMTEGFPLLIPYKRAGWHPTMVLNVQFFFPIPPASSPFHSSRTVGLFGTSNFLVDPLARHDTNVEVWTAPCNIGEGEIEEGWREKQVCLASASQMAVVMPLGLTKRKANL